MALPLQRTIEQLEERLTEAKLEISARERRELELEVALSASVTAQSQLCSDLEVSRPSTRNVVRFLQIIHHDSRQKGRSWALNVS
jgi:hypothetical protein